MKQYNNMEQPNNNKPNIIFLDFDGVLMSIDHMNAMHFKMYAATKLYDIDKQFASIYAYDKYNNHFDPRCVAWLEIIYEATKCDFVISSTWNQSGLKVLQQMWQDRNMPGRIIDIIDCHDRANAILKWLHEHDYVLTEHCWCTIDDETVFDACIDKYWQQYQIQPDSRFGLIRTDALNAIKWLHNIPSDSMLGPLDIIKLAKTFDK